MYEGALHVLPTDLPETAASLDITGASETGHAARHATGKTATPLQHVRRYLRTRNAG